MKSNLTRADNWSLINQLQNEVARLLDTRSLLNPLAPSANNDSSKIATGQWAPAVDIHEEPNTFVIFADLPGVTPDNIEITMENGILTIKGHREGESRVEESGYTRIERITGNFYRRFSLPDTADEAAIDAEFKQGVLKIAVPKKEKAKARKISVKTSG